MANGGGLSKRDEHGEQTGVVTVSSAGAITEVGAADLVAECQLRRQLSRSSTTCIEDLRGALFALAGFFVIVLRSRNSSLP